MLLASGSVEVLEPETAYATRDKFQNFQRVLFRSKSEAIVYLRKGAVRRCLNCKARMDRRPLGTVWKRHFHLEVAEGTSAKAVKLGSLWAANIEGAIPCASCGAG